MTEHGSHMSFEERRERRHKMAIEFTKCEDYEAVAEQFGVSRDTVYRAAREFGVNVDTRSTKAAARRSEMADLLKQGMSHVEIAKKFGVSPSTVYVAGQEHGIITSRVKASTYSIIGRLFDRGATFQEIGNEFGVSRQFVHQIYERCLKGGIPVPKRSKATKSGREDDASS